MVNGGGHGEPPGPRRLVVPSALRSVAVVRRFAVRACDEVGREGDADVVALLVSEVATNAVLHAGGAEISVRVMLDDGRLRIEVDDASSLAPVPRGAMPADEGGRGLALVDALALSWGVNPRRDGKTVWFEIDG